MRPPVFCKAPVAAPHEPLTVALCGNLAVAQGMVRALALPQAGVWRNAADAVAEWQGPPPELLLLIDLEPSQLATIVGLFKRQWPQIRTLVHGLPNHEESILGGVAAGADGIVLQEEPFDQLAEALQAVRAGAFRPPPKTDPPTLGPIGPSRSPQRWGAQRPAAGTADHA